MTAIDAVYQQSWYNLEVPKEAQDACRRAFKEINGVLKRLRGELEAAYDAVDTRSVASEVPTTISHVRAHKAWVTFLAVLVGDIDTRLASDAPNSGWLYLAEGLLQELDPDTAEMYSMQPRDREEDGDFVPLSDQLDRGDVLHMPPVER